jgi:hypothetical protein
MLWFSYVTILCSISHTILYLLFITYFIPQFSYGSFHFFLRYFITVCYTAVFRSYDIVFNISYYNIQHNSLFFISYILFFIYIVYIKYIVLYIYIMYHIICYAYILCIYITYNVLYIDIMYNIICYAYIVCIYIICYTYILCMYVYT